MAAKRNPRRVTTTRPPARPQLPMPHVVRIERDARPAGRRRRYRYRAACLHCEWSSPWLTTAPAWSDAPERSHLAPRSRILHAAEAHIRSTVVSRAGVAA